jgi:Archaeal ATPase.
VVEIAPGVETELVDRDRALAQLVELAEGSTWASVVVLGPEGCGKTAFLLQVASALRELRYDVFYLHTLNRLFTADVDDTDMKTLFVDLLRKTLEDEKWGRLALAVFDLTREILRKRRRNIAIVADNVFQAIGLDKAAYVKDSLHMIEHPVYKEYRRPRRRRREAYGGGDRPAQVGRFKTYVEYVEGGLPSAVGRYLAQSLLLRRFGSLQVAIPTSLLSCMEMAGVRKTS